MVTVADHDLPPGNVEADGLPRRVLIISAEMGEGHNAAADALTEAMVDMWPGCIVDRLDTMELRGRRFARAARWGYSFQLSVLPWTYDIFYHGLSRSARFASGARVAVGRFFGRRLARTLKARALAGSQPDLIISTYPFGSAALDWLRAHRGLSTLAVTYIPAFHVHRLWAYQGIDLHFVMYDTAADDAGMAGFEETMRIGAPPVRREFGSMTRAEARLSLSIPEEDFVVLMTGGAWGLGDIAAGVAALVKLDPPVHVVAVCGKNASLVSDLRPLEQTGRVTVHGYVTNMAELMAAANVVVTNGAGVTVLEALRTPRPVVAFSPLVGHGTASTAEMVRRHLALEARDVPDLVQQIRRLRTEPALLSKLERAGESWVEGRDLHRSLTEIEVAYKQHTKGAKAPIAPPGPPAARAGQPSRP